MKKNIGWFGLLVLVLIPSYVGAQSLAETAAKERERRKKSPAPATAKVYTDTDISPGGSAASSASGSASTSDGSSGTWTPPQAQSSLDPRGATRVGTQASGGDAKGEAYWRSRAASVRSQIESAENNLRSVERAANAKATQGTRRPDGCNIPQHIVQQGTEAMKRWSCTQAPAENKDNGIEAARASVQRSKEAWTRLEDEARRAGALPAWLR